MAKHSFFIGLRPLWILFVTLLFVNIVSCSPPKKSDCTYVWPEQSIQRAIDKAPPGHRIEVHGGEYHEQITINKDGIQLIGKNGATIKPPDKYYTNTCTGLSVDLMTMNETQAGICITGKDVELETYVAEHRKVSKVGTFVNNVVVSGFTIVGFDGENIASVGAINTIISRNKLTDGGQYGYLSTGCKGTRAHDNTITTTPLNFIAICLDDYEDSVGSYNTVDGYFTGLCAQTPGCTYTNNHVTNTCVGTAADPGVKGVHITDNYFAMRNPLCDNPITQAFGAGIVIFGASNSLVEHNTVENWKNNGTGAGIYLTNGVPGGEVATGNAVRGNVLRDNEFNIFDNSTGVNDVQGNTCAQDLVRPSVPKTACS